MKKTENQCVVKQLICQKEYLSCINYNHGSESIIKYSSYQKGSQWEKTVQEKTIVFVLAGRLSISYEEFIGKEIAEGHSFVMPPGRHFIACADSDVVLIVFKIEDEIRFCDRMSLNKLTSTNSKIEEELYLLKSNTHIKSFINNLLEYISEGFYCNGFQKLKIQELLYLLRAYYPKNILRSFFYPLLSKNMSFSDFVLKNYMKVKTVYEFAALSTYSISGFEKEFRKVFGSSAYQWMTEKKIKRLYHEINATNKTFKCISDEMNFSSLSQMNDYCKKHFGMPPGKMRMLNSTL